MSAASSDDSASIETAIAAIEASRALLGEAAAAAALRSLRERLAGESAATAQVLRLVSVLFLDIVDSTKLARQLDPETVHAVMDGALSDFTAVVRAHGGRVLQYAGDNLLAAFGVDQARENEAERAVSCGLALLDEGRRIGALVRARHGHEGFGVRVGVHTGLALLGGGVEGAGTIRGITVNVAARLEQAAPAGGLRVSAATWHALQEMFDGDAQPPIEVKGVDQPLASWIVRGPRDAALPARGRDVAGLRATLCGRAAELAALDTAAQAALAGPVTQLLLGEPGVGKSRLVAEFLQHQAEAGARPPLYARALPASQGQAFALLQPLVQQIAGAPSHAPWPGQEAALSALLAPAQGEAAALEQARLIGRLLGHDVGPLPGLEAVRDDPAQLRNRAFHGLRELLRLQAAAGPAPLAVVLDDLHWADEGSLDFIDQLQRADSGPLLLVLLARPALRDRRPQWSLLAQAHTLAPLDDAGSRALAERLLARVEAPPLALQALLTGRAQGNPFFMEELLRMLLDEGVLEADGPRWQVRADRLAGLPVPATLSALLQARLDRLPAPLRRALQQASITGPVVEPAWLAAIEPAAAERLPELVQAEFLEPGRGAALAFRHQLLQQVAYETVLRRDRLEWHKRLGEHLAAQGDGAYGEMPALAASHLERAERPAEAGRLYAHAHRLAGLRAPLREVQRLAERALALPHGATVLERWQLHQAAHNACSALGDEAGALPHIESMRELAREAGSPRLIAQTEVDALRISATGRVTSARVEAVLRIAEQAEADEPAAPGQPSPLRGAMSEWAWALCEEGRHAESRAAGLRLLQLAEAAGERGLASQGAAHNTIAVAAWQSGDLVAGLAHMERSVAIDRARGHAPSELSGLFNLAGFTRRLGLLERSLETIDAGLRLATRVGSGLMQQAFRARRAQLKLALDDVAGATADARACLRTQPPSMLGELASRTLGHALVEAGQPEAALQAFADAQALAGSAALAVESQAGMLRARVLLGDRAALREAVDALAHAMEVTPGIDASELPELLLALHDGLRALDDARADTVLARARAEVEAQAAKLADPAVRAAFLQGPPSHRRLFANPPAASSGTRWAAS